MENIYDFAEQLANLTVLECYQLAKIMKDEYGIEPKTNIAPIPTEHKEKQEIVIEKTEFDIVLKSAGMGKLGVIKAIKEMTGMSLLEIKTLVDNAPTKIKEGISKDEAVALENTLKELGAEIEVL